MIKKIEVLNFHVQIPNNLKVSNFNGVSKSRGIKLVLFKELQKRLYMKLQ